MARLSDLLEGRFAGDFPLTADDVADAVDLAGGTRQLADELGVSQRTVQRYVTTRTERRRPGADTLRRLAATDVGRELQRRRRAVDWARRGGPVTVGGFLRVSSDVRHRPPITADIDPDQLGGFGEAAQAGEWEAAADELTGAHLDEYGIGAAGEWLDVDDFEIEE